MSDPFAPDSRDQLIREAQRGLAIIAILTLIFGYIAIQRFRGDWNGIPEHVKNAPPSQTVWPYDDNVAARGNRESDRPNSETRSTDGPKEIDPGIVSNSLSQTIPTGNLSSEATTRSQYPRQAKQSQAVTSSQIDEAESFPQDSTFSSRSELATFESDALNPIGSSAPPKEKLMASSRTLENSKNMPDLPIPPANENSLQSQFKPIPNLPTTGESKPSSALMPRDPFGFSDSDDKPIEPSTPSKRFEGIDFYPVPLPNVKTESSNPAFPLDNRKGSPELESRLNEKGLGDPDLLAPQVRSASLLDSNRSDRNSYSSSFPGGEPKPNAGIEFKDSGIEYVVKEGDNFWSIAQAHYDDGRYFRPLYESNIGQIVDFDSPRPGTKIIIPSLTKLRKDFPDLCKTISFTPREGDSRGSVSVAATEPQKIRAAEPIATLVSSSKRTYITRNQDSLFKVAAEELGQASRYVELIELNRSSLPPGIDSSTPLAPGLILNLPRL